MSDTTLTPEERAKWRELVMPYPDGTIGNQDKRMLRLLDALEQAEARAEKAEANVARLTKMVDCLAGALAEDGCPYLAYWADFGGDMRPDWCNCTDTPDDGFDCTGDPKGCWEKEAARRAVADESGVNNDRN